MSITTGLFTPDFYEKTLLIKEDNGENAIRYDKIHSKSPEPFHVTEVSKIFEYMQSDSEHTLAGVMIHISSDSFGAKSKLTAEKKRNLFCAILVTIREVLEETLKDAKTDKVDIAVANKPICLESMNQTVFIPVRVFKRDIGHQWNSFFDKIAEGVSKKMNEGVTIGINSEATYKTDDLSFITTIISKSQSYKNGELVEIFGF